MRGASPDGPSRRRRREPGSTRRGRRRRGPPARGRGPRRASRGLHRQARRARAFSGRRPRGLREAEDRRGPRPRRRDRHEQAPVEGGERLDVVGDLHGPDLLAVGSAGAEALLVPPRERREVDHVAHDGERLERLSHLTDRLAGPAVEGERLLADEDDDEAGRERGHRRPVTKLTSPELAAVHVPREHPPLLDGRQSRAVETDRVTVTARDLAACLAFEEDEGTGPPEDDARRADAEVDPIAQLAVEAPLPRVAPLAAARLLVDRDPGARDEPLEAADDEVAVADAGEPGDAPGGVARPREEVERDLAQVVAGLDDEASEPELDEAARASAT